MLDAMRSARRISLGAYVLGGRMLDALASAAARGARVRVFLAATDFPRVNDDAAGRLRAAGAAVTIVDPQPGRRAALHAKLALIDDVAYVDDCNWTASAGDTILRDDRPADLAAVRDALEFGAGDAPSQDFAMRKSDALASEAGLLDGSRSDCDRIAVESESFGCRNAVYGALERAAERGGRPRLLVSERDLRGNGPERTALDRLVSDGVRVRVTSASNEKFALAGDAAWLGSANATPAYVRPDQIDWGMRTRDRAIVAHLRDTFDRRWNEAKPIRT